MAGLISLLTASERAALERRSSVVTVVYYDHPLPVGASVPAARVGVGPCIEGLGLFVDRGIGYAGNNAEVAEWLREGVRVFADFEALWEWIGSTFPPAVTHEGHWTGPPPWPAKPEAPADPSEPVVEPREPVGPADLTNLDQVQMPDEVRVVIAEVDLRSALLSHISGQEPAVSQLAAGVSRHVNKRAARKPYSAVLLGKTGVGKTETVRTLVTSLTDLTGETWQFVCLDMSEFSERISVSRLVGAPPGYIGHGDGNDLASKLAANPRTVVLFDEFEKANPVVWQSLLGLLDHGQLASERHGQVSAEQAVLVFTSNIGSNLTEQELTTGDNRSMLKNFGLAPELVGRLNHVIAFKDLSARATAEIAVRSVVLIAAEYGITIGWVAPTYVSDLLRRTADNKFGARMLEHLVEDDLGEQLAAWEDKQAFVEFSGVPVLTNVAVSDGAA